VTLDAAGFQSSTDATDAVVADLDAYRRMLIESNAVMNLVGPDTLADFWNRHALDSAQLIPHVPDARTWADLGAGAGLPGVVLAVFMKPRGGHVHLIDSLQKRCRFLQSVVDALDLPATVVWGRAEQHAARVDVVTARAVAPLTKLLGYAQAYHQKGAAGLYLKGEKAEAEVAEARKVWHFESQLFPSRSDARGRVVSVRSLRRVRQ
jgi:16S rRNA (guanine(527)-N(7))-methyltransferase GidB